MIFTIIEVLLLLTIIIVQIKQKIDLNALEDEIYHLNETLWWDLEIDETINKLKEKYEQTDKRGILGKSDRSNEYEDIERNRKTKHTLWT